MCCFQVVFLINLIEYSFLEHVKLWNALMNGQYLASKQFCNAHQAMNPFFTYLLFLFIHYDTNIRYRWVFMSCFHFCSLALAGCL